MASFSSGLLGKLIADGYKTIYSWDYYINIVHPWPTYYGVDPHLFPDVQNLTDSQLKENLLGIEACMWTTNLDSTNLIQVRIPLNSIWFFIQENGF